MFLPPLAREMNGCIRVGGKRGNDAVNFVMREFLSVQLISGHRTGNWYNLASGHKLLSAYASDSSGVIVKIVGAYGITTWPLRHVGVTLAVALKNSI